MTCSTELYLVVPIHNQPHFFPVVTVEVRSISLIKNAIDNRSCYLPSQVDDPRLNYSIRGVYSKRLLYNKYGIQLTL